MSVSGHRATARARVVCFVLTVSDTRTLNSDASGDAIADLLTEGGHLIAGRAIVVDEAAAITAIVRNQLADPSIEAVIITGGTGVSRRDSTFEAVAALI